MAETILEMPDAKFRELGYVPVTPQQSSRSGWTGTDQTEENPWHGYWEFSGDHAPIVGQDNMLAWRAFIGALRGRARLFRLPLGEAPQYGSAVAAVVDGDGQTLPRFRLEARGFPAGDPDFPKAGHFVTIDDQALLLEAVAPGSTADRRVLYFTMPLRNYAPDGVRIEAVEPYAVVGSAEDRNGWQAPVGQQYGFTIPMVEKRLQPLCRYDLALDFAARRYRAGSTYTTDITTLAGYSYSRAGAKSELNSAGTPVAFAENVPGIAGGVGYYARQAPTNTLLWSQQFDNAAWQAPSGGTVPRPANAATAPDGSTTAERATFGASGVSVFQTTTGISGGNRSSSIWARKPASGGATAVRISTNDGAAWGTGHSLKATLTTSWQRIVLQSRLSTASTSYVVHIGALDQTGAADADCYGDVELWQGQSLPDSHPDGGPIVVTAGAAASTGEDLLALGMGTLTDEDMLIWCEADVKALTLNPDSTQFFFDFHDGTVANRFMMRVTGGGYQAYSVAGGAAVLNITQAGATVGAQTMVLRRLGGAWRAARYSAGALTWFAAATSAPFPTGITRATPGNFLGGGHVLRGFISGLFIQPGTFDTEPKVIAALEAA